MSGTAPNRVVARAKAIIGYGSVLSSEALATSVALPKGCVGMQEAYLASAISSARLIFSPDEAEGVDPIWNEGVRVVRAGRT